MADRLAWDLGTELSVLTYCCMPVYEGLLDPLPVCLGFPCDLFKTCEEIRWESVESNVNLMTLPPLPKETLPPVFELAAYNLTAQSFLFQSN